MSFKIKLLLIIQLFLGAEIYAAIDYNEKENAIWVTDYPESLPCTLKKLLTVDNSFAWNKVSYDDASKTYTVNCNLWIGSNNNTNTFFQIGTLDNPTEKLIINGSIVVKPYWVLGENPGAAWWNTKMGKYVNRLTLGNAIDKNIAASLLINNEKNGKNGILVGSREQTKSYGGQFHVYNSAVSSFVQSKEQYIANIMLQGDSIILINAVLSNSMEQLAYGINSKTSIVKNTIFNNGKYGIYCGQEYITGSTFKNCNIAVIDSGSLDAVLVDCKFENNVLNWDLSYTDKGLTLIDCEIGNPIRSNVIKKWKNPKNGKENYPFVAVKKHIIINVADANNVPVKNATVTIKSVNGSNRPDDITAAVTNDKGMTPGKGENGALLLTESFEKATNMATEKTLYTYNIEISADGFKPVLIKDYKADIVNVILNK